MLWVWLASSIFQRCTDLFWTCLCAVSGERAFSQVVPVLPSAVGTAPRDAQQRTRTPGLSPDLLWKLQKCPFPPCHLVPDVPEAAHLHPVKNRNNRKQNQGKCWFFPFYQLIPFQNPIQNLEESHLRAAPFWLHHSLYAVMTNIKLTPALDWIRDGFATGATKFITRQGECNVIVPSVISAATLHSRSICLWEECHEYSRFLYLQLCFPGLIVFKFVHQNR